MKYSDRIYQEYNDMADKGVASVCRINACFMLVVALLDWLGVFIIDYVPLFIALGITMLIFLIPMFTYNILGIHREWLRYLILFMLVLQQGILYSVLSYHVILMLSFPVVAACLYSRRRYIAYTAALIFPMLIISHLAAFYLKIVPDEPLVTLKGTILYGLLPRCIEMTAFIVVSWYISARLQGLINKVLQKNEELYMDQENTLTSLSEIIESQSEHTGAHVKRVALYTEIICRGLGFSDDECWKISQASKMHDVGKIIIPSGILDKPGKLTDEEFEIVKKHTAYGRRMLEKAPGELFKLGAVIAYQHHEHFDGNGYHGMSGDEISIAARCVALADVFDALATERPYKKAWPLDKVKEEIISQKGKQFAPEVVDVFVDRFVEFKAICENTR